MLESSIAQSPRSTPFGLILLALVTAMPSPGRGENPPKTPLDGWVAYDQLALDARGLEERVDGYEAALAVPGSEDGKPRLSGFADVAADLSAAWDPERAFAAAHELTGEAGSRRLYERLGVVLLRDARQARFAQLNHRALHYLRAARQAFDLADQAIRADGTATGETDFVHRAMVRLEEILVTDSEEPWNEAAGLLEKQLQVTPTGPMADWARRIADDPDTYVAEQSLAFEAANVGGDIRRPAKIFAPPPRFTEIARRARVQGVVIVQAVIDRHGSVAALKLLKGLPMGISEEAMRAVSTWLFEPAKLDGQPVTVFYNLTINFRL